MKIEVSITASSIQKQELRAEFADLMPEENITEAFCKNNSGQLALNIFFEANSPDDLLQKIAAVVEKIENNFPGQQGIDVQVKNIESAEPSLCTVHNGEPFSPVQGIRLVPWNSTKSQTPAAHDIFLDPSHAFGTGLHPSTRLCMQLLKQVAERESEKEYAPCNVLDIGCGSGILTITALRLGATRALGIEIDPDAVDVARRNVKRNMLERSAQIYETSWQNISGDFDLILANLVPSVLLKAAPKCAILLSGHGLLITSGFPAAKNKYIRGLFKKYGLHLISESSLDGWGALLLKKT